MNTLSQPFCTPSAVDGPSALSKRWQSAPRELIDLVFAEAILTPLQVHASHGPSINRILYAANPEAWETVTSLLFISKATRAELFRVLSLHGALEHVPLGKIDPKVRSAMPVPGHALLRHFRWIYTSRAFQLNRDLAQTKLFINVPGPPRVNHVARIEIQATNDPREYTMSTQKMLIANPEAPAVKSQADKEDEDLMDLVNRLCRSAAWYWVFQPSVGPHLGHTVGTAEIAREIIVWESI